MTSELLESKLTKLRKSLSKLQLAVDQTVDQSGVVFLQEEALQVVEQVQAAVVADHVQAAVVADHVQAAVEMMIDANLSTNIKN